MSETTAAVAAASSPVVENSNSSGNNNSNMNASSAASNSDGNANDDQQPIYTPSPPSLSCTKTSTSTSAAAAAAADNIDRGGGGGVVNADDGNVDIRNRNNKTSNVDNSDTTDNSRTTTNGAKSRTATDDSKNAASGDLNSAAPAASAVGDAGNKPGTSAGSSSSSAQSDSRFECNICLDSAKDAVISMCGHLFCWPCLHQWLETRPTRQMCPVCKSAISREKVIPLYGRGGDQTDPRNKAPPRPQGQRTEPTTNYRRFNWNGDAVDGSFGGFQFSFGIGAFPFTLFGTTFTFGDDRRPDAPNVGTREYDEEQFISKVFIWIAVIFIVWLMIA